MANIQKVIALKGGNEYKEGRESKRAYKGRRKIGELFKHSWVRDGAEVDDEYEGIEDDGLDDQENDE
ncbi:hypothetical protein PV11_01800 [Exophiala sideris]|uniref:Uncharacterized protein n=1 Tax=Exophiala sideris TaxID=1016849 RepID=A0A0D1WBR0_9EURO|nr:hypothetical protein PV11_01800 [Exophiala sideris]